MKIIESLLVFTGSHHRIPDETDAISLWSLNNKSVDFLVQAADQMKVNHVLQVRGLDSSTKTIIEDVQRTLDELRPTPPVWDENALRNGHRLDWKSYPTLPIIDEYLNYLENKFPSLCKIITIGHSVEDRPIKVFRISNGDPKNKAIMMTAGIHAREWISITSALYLIDTVATNFDQLPKYMRSIDWSIVPVLNPDGYEYSHTKDRLWRKNRRKMQNSHCIGIDLNRNFGFNWYIPNVTKNNSKCHNDYPGSHPFSEPETEAMRNYVGALKKMPDAFMDVHSYSQIIMYPWSSKPEPAEDSEHLRTVADIMTQEIFKTTGAKYFYGQVYTTMYPCSGSQIDWMYSLGVRSAYAIEMRDSELSANGTPKGFLLPPDYIEPTGSDLVAAISQLAEILVANKITMTKTNHELSIGSFLNYTLEKITKFMG